MEIVKIDLKARSITTGEAEAFTATIRDVALNNLMHEVEQAERRQARLLTLFRTYRTARNRMETARASYGGRHGIGENSDFWALLYQRYDRLERKLRNRIERELGGEYEAGACVICGWPEHICSCKAYRTPKHRNAR